MQTTPSISMTKRDELLRVLELISLYPENAEFKMAFKRAMDQLQPNSFEVAILGGFCGGISTTFNAICERRCSNSSIISVCKISAHNIVAPNEKEHAVIRWKTDDELILILLDFLRACLDDAQYQKIEVRDNYGHFINISLDNPTDVQRIKECLDKEWTVYKKCPAMYDPGFVGKLDLLYVASLIMHFRNDPLIKKLRKENLVTTIEEMQSCVTVPLDWGCRWSQCTPEAFQSNEAIWAFVADIHCYLHSPNLKRLGCVITIIPELFDSPWDTMVARETMQRADAILYLLPSQIIGMRDLVALKEIQRMRQFHKIVLAINARTSYEYLRETICPSDASIINNFMQDGGHQENGGEEVRIKPEDISIFNAWLAYNSKYHQGDDAKEDWTDVIESNLCTFLGLNNRQDCPLLDDLIASPENLFRASKCDELFHTVEMMVAQEKFRFAFHTNDVVYGRTH